MKRLLLILVFMLVPGVALACPDWQQDPYYKQLRYSGPQLYNPKSFDVVAGGDQRLAGCGIRNNTQGKPRGIVSYAPDFELVFRGNGYELEFRVESDCDSILLINTGAGNWYYDDDDAGNLDAKIRLNAASDGVYDIWIGTREPGNCNARLILETF